ncbi:hypothetical protein GCM10010276_00440 [Streptomyces longisporus]|uniref:Uncharacterized protein n=1 Tax=Streptomyces longisporus TaxID=1948 RepID=A0ABN3KRN2_STRLO
MLEPVDHRLVQSEPAALQMRYGELVQLLLQIAVVADQEPLHTEALLHQVRVVEARWRRVGGVVLADRADPDDAPELAQRPYGGGQLFAADVVDEDVDAVRCGLGEQVGGGSVVVVEDGVVADLPREVIGLRGRARAAHEPPGAEQAGEPSGRGADPARRGRHEQVLALLQPGDPGQPHIGGQAGATEDAQVRRQGHAVEAGQPPDLLRRDHRVGAPALPVEHDLALGQPGRARGDDPPDGAALQRCVKREAAGHLVHHLAVIGVDGPVEVLHQRAAGGGLGKRGLHEGEVFGGGEAVRAGGLVHGERGLVHERTVGRECVRRAAGWAHATARSMSSSHTLR